MKTLPRDGVALWKGKIGAAGSGALFFLCFALIRLEAADVTTMISWVTQREACLWVQSSEDAVVKAQYWPAGDPAQQSETVPVLTSSAQHQIGTLLLSGLLPGKRYEGQLFINGHKQEGAGFHFETVARNLPEDPPATIKLGLVGGFRDADPIADGAIRSLPVRDGLAALATKNPQAVLWLGNTAPLRNSDWSSEAGYWRRFTASRGSRELVPLLNSCAHYALLGAQDYGPTEATSTWLLRSSALDCFRAFWPAPSPSAQEQNAAANAQISLGDVDVFFLDSCTQKRGRILLDDKQEFFGPTQLRWLIDALRASQASVKIVVAGVSLLNPVEAADNFASAKAERNEWLAQLESVQIDGLIVITGSPASSEATKMPRARGYPLYELSLGSISDPAGKRSDALNYFRVPGTLVSEPHFGMITLSGPRESREIRWDVFNTAGESIWADTLPLKNLKWK